MSQDTPPSALVIPFGKHKGTTVEELLAKDPAYAQWLMAQGWLAERFAELHSAILTRGAGQDDSPEHNAIQGRFLDPVFRIAFLLTQVTQEKLAQERKEVHRRMIDWHQEDAVRLGIGKPQRPSPPRHAPSLRDDERGEWNEYLDTLTQWEEKTRQWEKKTREKAAETTAVPNLQTSVQFEVQGIDAVISWGYGSPQDHDCKVEIKPTMGEDYPTIMRQMARLRARFLVVGSYTGRALPFTTVRAMFVANNDRVVTMQEIEAEIPNARAMVL